MLSESDIISNLGKIFPMIGDDCAVLPLNDEESYVISKDILVEHRHFRLTTTDATSLAHKALHVNLSDIAAMGATPLYVMMGIAWPPQLEKTWVEQFLTGFSEACQAQNLQLIGGDTTASERDVFISITVIGRAKTAHLKYRNGAKKGDVVCVVGSLGEAHAGLTALEHKIAGLDAVKMKSLAPHALVAEGQWLGTQTGVTAMMDVSDGLYIDLGKLVTASKHAAIIDMENLQPSLQLVEACVTLKLDPRESMLAGGEDYALLFTVEAAAYDKIAAAFRKQFGYGLQKIGAIADGNGVQLREGGQPVALTLRPFSHFGEL